MNRLKKKKKREKK